METEKTTLKPWQFKPGQSGNPRGRPKGHLSLTDALRKYFRKHPEEFHAVIVAFVEVLKKGNVQAFQELLNRFEGRVTERHELEARLPITLVFRPAVEIDGGEETHVLAREDGDDTEHLADGHPLALQASKH